MGRKTYEDIGRPLPGRLNIVVIRRPGYRAEGCLTAGSLAAALALCPAGETEAFIIGGEQLFAEAMALADRIYLTELPLTVEGDAFFPEVPASEFALASSERFEAYTLHVFDRIRPADAAATAAHRTP
jgi:dihydrofolate reductase